MPLTKTDLTCFVSLPNTLERSVDLATLDTIAIESILAPGGGVELRMTLDVLTSDTAFLIPHTTSQERL